MKINNIGRLKIQPIIKIINILLSRNNSEYYNNIEGLVYSPTSKLGI